MVECKGFLTAGRHKAVFGYVSVHVGVYGGKLSGTDTAGNGAQSIYIHARLLPSEDTERGFKIASKPGVSGKKGKSASSLRSRQTGSIQISSVPSIASCSDYNCAATCHYNVYLMDLYFNTLCLVLSCPLVGDGHPYLAEKELWHYYASHLRHQLAVLFLATQNVS